MNKKSGQKERSRFGVCFLALVILVYLLLFVLQPETTQIALKTSGRLLVKIIPIFLLVILFMGITNHFLHPKMISKYLGKGAGIKGWLLATSTGVLSHGPIYAWYPLLKELRGHGMRSGLVAVFLYNRAIKIPLLPLMVYYFSITFVVVLLIYMIIASLVEGKIIEIIER
jgi:uncharacterized membrane protein YraQ (UPF0718 family)